MTAIKPSRIRDLRNRNRITRANLARKSGVSERQIARIEGSTEEFMSVREHTVKQLAITLGAPMGVLTGEEALPEARSAPLNPDMDLQLQFDLVRYRYGIKQKELTALAPFLFTVLAEATIVWHRKRQKEFEACREKLKEIVPPPPESVGIEDSRLRVSSVSDSFVHDLFDAAKEIDLSVVSEKTLFGEYNHESRDYLSKANPFDQFILNLFQETQKDDKELEDGRSKTDNEWQNILSGNIFDSWGSGSSGFQPDAYHLLNTVVAQIIGREQFSPEELVPPSSSLAQARKKMRDGEKDEWWLAASAIFDGTVRIRDIPENLWAEEKTKERVSWIASHLGKDYEVKVWEEIEKDDVSQPDTRIRSSEYSDEEIEYWEKYLEDTDNEGGNND